MNRNPYAKRGRVLKYAGTGKLVTLEDAQTTLPAPSVAGDGGDISGWADQEGMMPEEADLLLTGANTVEITDPTLYEYVDGVWYSLGKLNGGQNIALTAAIGFKHPLYQPVGTRLAVGGTLSAVVAVTVKAIPKIIASD